MTNTVFGGLHTKLEQRPLEKPHKAQRSVARPARQGNYLKTLDGWRAVAVLIVLLDHSPTMHLWRLNTAHFHLMGSLGVDIFFAISGLLICSRLLEEEARTGTLNLKGFYIRRIARIQPPALLMLAAVAGLTMLHRLPPYTIGILASLLLVRNYVGNAPGVDPSWPTAHFWSLSVEEHFYLLLPAFLCFVRKGRGLLLLSLAAINLVWRFFVLAHSHEANFQIITRTDVCLHMLLLPAAIAVFLRGAQFRHWATRFTPPLVVFALTLIAIPDHSPLHKALLVLPTLLVMSTLLHNESFFGRLLELAPLRFIGRISYGIYLWQELFLNQHFAPSLHPFGALQHTWITWPLIFLCAVASHYLLEKPFMRFGHRLAKPALVEHTLQPLNPVLAA